MTELLDRVRQDAKDYLMGALKAATLGNWEDAEMLSDIAHDRLVFAWDIEAEMQSG